MTFIISSTVLIAFAVVEIRRLKPAGVLVLSFTVW